MAIEYLNGNCLEKLKELPEKSVYTCVTSPPYWGLRDYGVEPTVWDEESDCEHDWNEHINKNPNAGGGSGLNRERDGDYRKEGYKSDFCSKCRAWRGQLGLEPTPELYIKHLTDIFREVKRVLKDDGTLWLNLGDSYWGGKGQSGQCDAELQEKRNKDGKSINKSHHQVAGSKKTRPQDGKHDSIKPKDLVGIPWMTAFALRKDGWYLRSDIIWSKSSCMPESVKDRPTKSHEYIFLLSKNKKYYYDYEAIKEDAIHQGDENRGKSNCESKKYKGNEKYGGAGTSFDGHIGLYKSNGELISPDGKKNKRTVCEVDEKQRGFTTKDGNNPIGGVEQHHGQNIKCGDKKNKRSVWSVNPKPFKDAHFAVYPEELITPCILAGCPEDGTVIDPFGGSGTTALVCQKLKRNCILIDINEEYVEMQKNRTGQMFLWEK